MKTVSIFRFCLPIIVVCIVGVVFALLQTQNVSAQSSTFSFGFAGDIGANSRSNATLSRIGQENLNFFLAVGDMSYDEVTPESAWCDYVKQRVGQTFPFEIVTGNHEEQGGPDGYIKNFAACLPDRLNSQPILPGRPGYPANYYFDYPASNPYMRVLMISAELDYEGVNYKFNTSEQTNYNALSSLIDQAKQQGMWTVVAVHKVCITTGEKSCEIGTSLMNLLISKRVDLVLQGHEHNYQRSKQLTCAQTGSYNPNCVVDSDNSLQRGAGTVFLINGMGGRCCYDVNPKDSEAGYFATMVGNDAVNTSGFVKFTISPSAINGTFVSTVGTVNDSFSIGGTVPNTPSPTQPPTQPTATPTPATGSCTNTLPTGVATVTTTAEVPTSGEYTLWSRINPPNGTNNEFWIQFDDECPVSVGGATIPQNTWTWIDYQDGVTSNKIAVPLNEGSHIIRIVEKDPGVKIDKLMLLSSSCIPTGTGENCTNSITPTPTVSQPTPTQPASTTAPTATIAPNSIQINLDLLLHGIGRGGDNAAPGSLGNSSPSRTQREVTVEVYDDKDQKVAESTGTVTFNTNTGNFTGTIPLGTKPPQGQYFIRLKTPSYLKRLVTRIITFASLDPIQLPKSTLVAGDINNDNTLNVIDYSLILDCYSDLLPPLACNPNKKLQTDLTDDGKVNQFDYNLLLRNLSVQYGD